MGIRKNVENYLAKRLFGYGPIDDWSYVDQFQGPQNDVKLLGMYTGLAYRCIDLISEGVASKYAPYPYKLSATGKEITVPNHPFWKVLQDPNPDVSFYDLFEGSQTFVEMFGEFFWYMVPGSITGYNKGVKEIYLLRPDKMGIVLDKATGDVIGYNYAAGSGQTKIPFTPEEIMHYKKFNPKNPYRGKSALEAAIEYVMTEVEVSRFTRNYFRNNAAMSGIINVNGKVSRENWNKFVRQWRERYQGTDNAGKVALIRDSQIEFTPISSSIGDMQLTELKETTLNQMLLMFKVPKGLLGMSEGEGMGRASVETLEYIFSKWTLDNKLSRNDDLIQKILKKYYSKLDTDVLIGHKSIIPDDKEYLLSYYAQGTDKWITRQEVRERDPELANNKIPGANQLFAAINQIPLEEAAEATPTDDADEEDPPTPAATDDDSNNDDDSQTDDSNDEDNQDDADGKGLRITVAKSKKKVAKKLAYTKKHKENFRSTLEKNSEQYAKLYKRALANTLKEQKGRVIANLAHLHKAMGDDLFDMADENAALNNAVDPIQMSLALEQGKLAMEFAGSEEAYELSKSIENAVKSSTARMSANYNEETVSQLSDTITEGVQEGEGLSKLTKRVEQVYEAATGWRAERVARTESMYASNAATVDGYKQTGYVIKMEWYANPGHCMFCDTMDGKTVGLEDNFVSQGDSVSYSEDGKTHSMQADYRSIDAPPLHPNCACTIIPITAAS